MEGAVPVDSVNVFVAAPSVLVPGADTGPLAGITIAVKDVIDVAGVVTSVCVPEFAAAHEAAAVTAPAVGRLDGRGATVVGKTVTDQLVCTPSPAPRCRRGHPSTRQDRAGSPAAPRPDRLPRSRPASSTRRSAPTPAARSGCRRATAASSGGDRPTGASTCGASSTSRGRSTPSGSSPETCRSSRRPPTSCSTTTPHRRSSPPRGSPSSPTASSRACSCRSPWRSRRRRPHGPTSPAAGACRAIEGRGVRPSTACSWRRCTPRRIPTSWCGLLDTASQVTDVEADDGSSVRAEVARVVRDATRERTVLSVRRRLRACPVVGAPETPAPACGSSAPASAGSEGGRLSCSRSVTTAICRSGVACLGAPGSDRAPSGGAERCSPPDRLAAYRTSSRHTPRGRPRASSPHLRDCRDARARSPPRSCSSVLGCVLMLEILAGRLLAPYVGISLETYTSIIGTVLAGIAVGHVERRQARRPHRPPPAARPDHRPRRRARAVHRAGGAVVRHDSAADGSRRTTMLLAFTGFFLPAFVLSAVTRWS